MTAKGPELKPALGVHRPKGTGYWHWQKKVPTDLLEHPSIAGKQWAFRGSLETADLREANARAAAKLAALSAHWDTLRASQKATDLAHVTPAMVDAIALRVKAAVLSEDESLRADPAALALYLANWWQVRERGRKLEHERAVMDAQTEQQEPPPYRPLPVPHWLTSEGQDEMKVFMSAGHQEVVLGDLWDLLQQRHQEAALLGRKALGRGNTGPFLVLASREATALGISIAAEGWTSIDAKPLRDACQRAYLEALEGLALRDAGEVIDTPVAPTGIPAVQPLIAPAGLTLGEVAAAVLKAAPENDYKRKLSLVIKSMLEVLGASLPVQSLRQAHVTKFLADICKLPRDWYVLTAKGATIKELLEQEHAVCISPSTYENTYRSCVSTFLKRAKHEFQDQGFPVGLGVEFANYKGTREEAEDQQRNFKPAELKRLFESPEYAAFAKAPDEAHKYWLPLLSLYTGARPRELCQVNPQVDLGEEEGVPYILISEQTAADVGVVKTVKTGEERKIPIHPELIRLGFLDYLSKLKQQQAMRMFPGFPLHKGNPAARAGGWFSGLLSELGLRDETPQARISGLYAFRKTFITEANRLGLRFEPITGHVDSERSKVVRDSYIMEALPVADKLAVLERVRFVAAEDVAQHGS